MHSLTRGCWHSSVSVPLASSGVSREYFRDHSVQKDKCRKFCLFILFCDCFSPLRRSILRAASPTPPLESRIPLILGSVLLEMD